MTSAEDLLKTSAEKLQDGVDMIFCQLLPFHADRIENNLRSDMEKWVEKYRRYDLHALRSMFAFLRKALSLMTKLKKWLSDETTELLVVTWNAREYLLGEIHKWMADYSEADDRRRQWVMQEEAQRMIRRRIRELRQ
jgi:hypothetical protein